MLQGLDGAGGSAENAIAVVINTPVTRQYGNYQLTLGLIRPARLAVDC